MLAMVHGLAGSMVVVESLINDVQTMRRKRRRRAHLLALVIAVGPSQVVIILSASTGADEFAGISSSSQTKLSYKSTNTRDATSV